jgi:hypothetical protein
MWWRAAVATKPDWSASRLLTDALAAAYRGHQAIEGPAGKPATTTSLSLIDIGAGPKA